MFFFDLVRCFKEVPRRTLFQCSLGFPRHRVAAWHQEDEPNGLATYTEKLHRLGLGKQEMETKISAMRALQSQRAGVPERQTVYLALSFKLSRGTQPSNW